MSEPSVQQLFRKWRGGDAASGQDMAQKFSDWYYAIATVRVPDQTGREPLEAACAAFAQGITSVTRPSSLVDWAHDLLERELQAIDRGLDSDRPTGGDHPNAMTQNRSPTQLLQSVAKGITLEQRQILALAYQVDIPTADLDRFTSPFGGTPVAVLQARYALKRVLRDQAEVPFSVVPDAGDMDRAPISLYEAARLASPEERSGLEKWLLSDIDLCKDVAEFAAFVHALRGGAFESWAKGIKVGESEAAEPAKPAKPAKKAKPAKPAKKAKPAKPAKQAEEAPPAVAEKAPEPEVASPPVEAAAAVPAPPAAVQPVAVPARGGLLGAMLWTGLVVFLGIVLALLILITLLQG